MQNLQAFGFSRVSPLDAHFGLFARAVFKTALETLGPCFPYEKTGRVLDDVQNSGAIFSVVLVASSCNVIFYWRCPSSVSASGARKA